MLAETGFELKKVTADFTDRPPSTESERLFFTAGKPKPSFKRNDGFKMHFFDWRGKALYGILSYT